MRTDAESCDVESMSARTFPLKVIDHRCVICNLAVVLIWSSGSTTLNLLLLVNVERGLDTLDASMALNDRCSLSSTAHSRSAPSASVRLRSLLSRGSVPAFLEDQGKASARSGVVGGGRQANLRRKPLSSTCGCLLSALLLHEAQV